MSQQPVQPTNKQINIAAKHQLFSKSYYHFFKYFWKEVSAEEFTDNWHIAYLCNELQTIGYRLKNREPKLYDLIINVPPGSSKSTIATILFPVWLWTIDPTLKILSGSYGQSLSLDHAVKSRDVILSERFQEIYGHYVQIKPDANNKSSYENTAKGVRASTSVQSGIIGRHYHIHIVDDPVQANASNLELETANEWITTKLSTRKVNKKVTPLILIMQRISLNDPTAILLEKNKSKDSNSSGTTNTSLIKHINLPAELADNISPPELSANYVNGLFDPIRLSADILDDARLTLGSAGYEGQFMQQPVSLDGGIIKKDWIGTPVIVPAEIYPNITWNMFIDSAYTAKAGNDPSAILIAGVYNNILYIKYSYFFRLEFVRLIEEIKKLSSRHLNRNSRIFIEPKASGKSIAQSLKHSSLLNVIELESTKDDKISRVNAIAPILESRRVLLLDDSVYGGGWNKQFIQECITFPKARHDDQVDCLVYAVNRLLRGMTKLSYRFV